MDGSRQRGGKAVTFAFSMGNIAKPREYAKLLCPALTKSLTQSACNL